MITESTRGDWALDLALAMVEALRGEGDRLARVSVEAESWAKRHAEEAARGAVFRGRRPQVRLEEEVQAILVAALRAGELRWERGGWGIVSVHHSPLGFLQTRSQRGRAAQAGSGSGWADLDVRMVDREGRPRALLLELKTGTRREDGEQRKQRERLVAAGHDAVLCRGLREASEAVLLRLGRDVSHNHAPF